MLKISDLAAHNVHIDELSIPEGECLGVTGPSGVGKTLLLRAICDIDVNTGDIALDDIIRDGLVATDWRRLVAYVPAESGWWADTVGEHFENPDAATETLTGLGLPPDVMNWQVARLSTGERQRLALVRALENNPRVLLLDEPTASLDPDATNATESLIRSKIAEGAIILLVSHDAAQIRRLANRSLKLPGGEIVETERES